MNAFKWGKSILEIEKNLLVWFKIGALCRYGVCGVIWWHKKCERRV
jgi:hypothetical protein